MHMAATFVCQHQPYTEHGQSAIAHNPQYEENTPRSHRLIVSFHTYEILATDSRIEQILGFCDSELHGSSILLFSGPITDSLLIRRAIDSAAASKTTQIQSVLYHKSGIPHIVKIGSSPFYDASNILVACMLDFQYVSEDIPATSRGGESSIKAEHSPPASDKSDQTCLGFLSLPGQDGVGPAIFPRRKGGSGGPVQPVVITLDILKTLEGHPLNEAAHKLGVSATAFKHACRKLGIPRWSYKKGGGHAAKPCVINNAYVQKLYRKYTAERRAAAQTPPAIARPPSAADTEITSESGTSSPGLSESWSRAGSGDTLPSPSGNLAVPGVHVRALYGAGGEAGREKAPFEPDSELSAEEAAGAVYNNWSFGWSRHG